jgi:hypothetical protein
MTAVTFITEQGEVDKDSEASHNSAPQNPFREVCASGLFYIQEICTTRFTLRIAAFRETTSVGSNVFRPGLAQQTSASQSRH